MNLDREPMEGLRTPRPSIMDLNLLDPIARASFIEQRRQEQTPLTSKLRTPMTSAINKPPPTTPRLGTIGENESFQTPSTSRTKTPKSVKFKKEGFVPAVDFDFEKPKNQSTLLRLSIMDVNLLDPIARANFVEQRRQDLTPSISKFRAPLKSAIRKPSATSPAKTASEDKTFQTPLVSKFSKLNMKQSATKKETIVPTINSNEAKDKPALTRPSIMNVNLLDPIARANFIAQRKEYDQQRRQGVAFSTGGNKENL